MKEINLKTIKHINQNINQNKRKQNHQFFFTFFSTKQTKVVRVRPTFMGFQWPLKNKFDKELSKQ